MDEGERFPFLTIRARSGDAHLRPLLPLTLSANGRSVQAHGLLDTGADVNVLPHGLGIAAGAEWTDQLPTVRLSGNLALVEARGIILDAYVGELPPVRLAFAWIRTDDVPLILGQTNFFAEFDVCFYRARGYVQVRTKS
jgi:hypothetical protein